MLSSALKPPELSKYELAEEIGHGGMATVYRARDVRLERDVAVKLLHKHLRDSLEVRARFASEARAVAKLRHPNIVEVFDVSDEDDEERYLVVELVRGVTLRQLLKDQETVLPVELAAQIVLEIGVALEHAHANQVIHRDIKPENVLLELPRQGARGSADDLDRPRVKLTDFGIAKLLDSEGVTSTGQVLGSPAHMAPEQIEGRSVDGRADVFSLGVLFYECLVGQLPFAGKNPAQVLRNVLEGNFQPADVLQPRVGSRWSRVVSKALQREPEQRYETIAAFVEAMRSELKRLGFESPRREVNDYLADPAAYRVQFAERIVVRLRDAAQAARQRRDMSVATADYSRALVYRPGDAALLASVSTLRTRHWLRWSVVALIGSTAVAAGVVKLWPLLRSDDATSVGPTNPSSSAQAAAAPTSSARPSAVTAPSAAEKSAPSPEPELAPRPKPRPVRGTAPGDEEPNLGGEEEVPSTRRVSIRIAGASGGSVKIDGREVPWFGRVNDVSVGTHVFEFLPPNDSCCSATKRQIDVPVGEGTLVVMGSIPFKDAVFVAKTPDAESWTVSCPTLFAGALKGPGRRSIPLSQAEVSGSCLVSNPKAGLQAGQKVITLRAGQTSTLVWP